MKESEIKSKQRRTRLTTGTCATVYNVAVGFEKGKAIALKTMNPWLGIFDGLLQ